MKYLITFIIKLVDCKDSKDSKTDICRIVSNFVGLVHFILKMFFFSDRLELSVAEIDLPLSLAQLISALTSVEKSLKETVRKEVKK